MDREYQRRLLAAEFAALQEWIAVEGVPVAADLVDGMVFLRLHGPGGPGESYQVKIEPHRYPVGPWRIGFIDPSAEGAQRFLVPDRDPRFWPYSQVPGLHGGFHVHYPGPYRIFICHQFTTEYFAYHADEQPWRPDVYGLRRVVEQLGLEIAKAVHFSRWWDGLFALMGG